MTFKSVDFGAYDSSILADDSVYLGRGDVFFVNPTGGPGGK